MIATPVSRYHYRTEAAPMPPTEVKVAHAAHCNPETCQHHWRAGTVMLDGRQLCYVERECGGGRLWVTCHPDEVIVRKDTWNHALELTRALDRIFGLG